jgi:uncharacterized protein (DUF1684 family)
LVRIFFGYERKLLTAKDAKGAKNTGSYQVTLRRTIIALLAASMLHAAPAVDPAYQKSFDKWKTELVEGRRKNWLPLAGLFWLKPGENSFGSDAGNAVVFPKGPAKAGWFELKGADVMLKLLPGVGATIAGKAVTSAKLEPDTSKDRTVVEMGSLRFHVIVRGQRVGIRLKDLDSAAARAYTGPVFYPLNAAYRVTAKFVPSDGTLKVDVPNVLGDVEPVVSAGKVMFELNGQKLELTDLGGSPAEGLSFVFNDLTSKTATYPGGRFLDTDPVSNGTVVLDFNEAYSPPCSVTPYATCPLAPKENRLKVAVAAGEKYRRKLGHH